MSSGESQAGHVVQEVDAIAGAHWEAGARLGALHLQGVAVI